MFLNHILPLFDPYLAPFKFLLCSLLHYDYLPIECLTVHDKEAVFFENAIPKIFQIP